MPRQVIQLSLRHPGPPDLDRTPTSDLEAVLKEAEAGLPEEQATSEYRQETDFAARSHKEGRLGQVLEPSLHCPGILYPELATTSESELEEVKDALPFCALRRQY